MKGSPEKLFEKKLFISCRIVFFFVILSQTKHNSLLINDINDMKKAFFTLIIVLLGMTMQAQIKVHSDGHVSISTLSGAWNVGTQFYPGETQFNSLNTEDWNWVTIASPNAIKAKCWIVSYPGNKYDHRFFVTADGYLFKRGSWRASDASLQSSSEAISGAGAVLDQITGIWYFPAEEGKTSKGGMEDRHVGMRAQEVQKVLPEAVTADENGKLYVDCEALTVFLIEALKEQKREVEILCTALEENGLLKPGK